MKSLKEEIEAIENEFEAAIRGIVQDELNRWIDFQLEQGALKQIVERLEKCEHKQGQK